MLFTKFTIGVLAALVSVPLFAGEMKILECKSSNDEAPRVDGVLSVYLSDAKVDQLKTYKKVGSWADPIFEKNIGFLQYRVAGNVIRKRDGKITEVNHIAFGRLYSAADPKETALVPSLVQIFMNKSYGEDGVSSFGFGYGKLDIYLHSTEAEGRSSQINYYTKLTCNGIEDLPTLNDILPAPPTDDVKVRFVCETTPSDSKRSDPEKFTFTLRNPNRVGLLEFIDLPGESAEETVFIQKLSKNGEIADAVNTEGSVIGSKRTIRIHGDQISMVLADLVLAKPKTPGDSIKGTVDFERSSATTEDGKTLRFRDAVACTTELVK